MGPSVLWNLLGQLLSHSGGTQKRRGEDPLVASGFDLVEASWVWYSTQAELGGP